MLLAGDEIGNSQGGNNNVYCQDNEISWINWEAPDHALLAFTRMLLAIRHDHPALRCPDFCRGRDGERPPDILWMNPAGREQTTEDWAFGEARTLGLLLDGRCTSREGERFADFGAAEPDRCFLLLMNAHHEAVPFVLPPMQAGWERLVDTADPSTPSLWGPAAVYPLQARSLVLLMQREST